MGWFGNSDDEKKKKQRDKDLKEIKKKKNAKDEEPEIRKLAGRHGDPIFIEHHNDQFIDACDFLPDLNHCKYCDTGKFACDSCQDDRCRENTRKLAKKHGLREIEHMLHYEKHHKGHHHHDKHHERHHSHDYEHHDHHHKQHDHHHDHHHGHHHHDHHDHHHSRNSHHLTYIEDKLRALERRKSDREYSPSPPPSTLSSMASNQSHSKSSKYTCGLTCGTGRSKRRGKRYEVHIYLCSSIWHNEQVTKLRMTMYHTTQLHGAGENHDYQNDKQFNAEMLRAHNIRRTQHKVDHLKLNMKLSEKAQEYADWLASRGSFEHSDTLVGKHRTFGEDGGPCGENMVYSEGREGVANMSGDAVTNTWYKTRLHYDWACSEDLEKKCANFTQMVWRSSKLLGVGRAVVSNRTLGYCVKNMTSSKLEKIFVVALYYPRGNVDGYYCQNVYRDK